MTPIRKRPIPGNQADFISSIQRERAMRGQGYREQALRLFPHVCARCGREFSGKTLRELTVHHKDHNHLNNPPDGSNWELLCLYCHDYEHEGMPEGAGGANTMARHAEPELRSNPFATLKNLLNKGENTKSD
ncbi:MAG: hypothetical protein AMXMBFR84_44670 [Candidatus Hydrogenedentota bacterium]